MTPSVPSTDLLAYTIGGPVAKIARNPKAWIDRRFPATRDDLDAVALVVRDRPEYNTDDSAGKLLDIFAWHRLNSIGYVRDLVDTYGLDRVTLALELLFEAGVHAHRDRDRANESKYDPTAGIKELLELFSEIEDMNPDFEFTPESLNDLAERTGDIKELMGLSGYELAKALRSEDDVNEAEFPLDASLRDERDRLTESIDDEDPADVHYRMEEPLSRGKKW
jgi:hypothetical protein